MKFIHILSMQVLAVLFIYTCNIHFPSDKDSTSEDGNTHVHDDLKKIAAVVANFSLMPIGEYHENPFRPSEIMVKKPKRFFVHCKSVNKGIQICQKSEPSNGVVLNDTVYTYKDDSVTLIEPRDAVQGETYMEVSRKYFKTYKYISISTITTRKKKVDYFDWEDKEIINAEGSGTINYYNDNLLLTFTRILFEYKNSYIKIYYDLEFMDGQFMVSLDYEGENQAFKDLVENEPMAVIFSGPIKTSDSLTVGTFQVLANERVVILDQKGQVIRRTVSLEDKNGLKGNWRLVRMAQFSKSGEFIDSNSMNLICPTFLKITADEMIKFSTEEGIRCSGSSENDIVICDTLGKCYLEPDVYFAEAAGPNRLALDNLLYRWSFHGDTLVLENPWEEGDFTENEPSNVSWHEYYLSDSGPMPPSDGLCGFCQE